MDVGDVSNQIMTKKKSGVIRRRTELRKEKMKMGRRGGEGNAMR